MWKKGLTKIRCPVCGYEMPVLRSKNASCEGLFLRCKGRNCGRWFEIKIERSK